jgi:hypothetical protein
VFADFYSTFATVSLTVTGLWMYVAQARFREWIADRDHFRRASAVSVQLAFPGMMCLLALIDSESTLLWRWAFGVTSALAIALLIGLNRRSRERWARANQVGNWVAALLFAAIGVVAVFPEIADDLNIPSPRNIEFFLFCLLLFNGLVVAWFMLFAEAQEEASPD